MALVVCKFGGTSVADAERIKNVAARLVAAKEAGNDVVAVVSARGKRTDELLALAAEITPDPEKRELDMLVSTGEQESVALMSMAIHALGHSSVSLIASQIGMMTDTAHTKAKLLSINTERIQTELQNGNIVIVAGFQGVDSDLNITTLGRGGSNLTAVALAGALKADVCENYTDVDGVYTADPNTVPDARKLDAISYDEMLELASLGASVLQSRSVEFAKKYSVPIAVRSSFSHAPGTLVTNKVEGMDKIYARGVAINNKEAKITILDVPDKPGVAASILKGIVGNNIAVDMIIQNVSHEGHTDLTFTVLKTDLNDALHTVTNLAGKVGASKVTYDENVAKLSVVGLGMRSHSGVAHKIFAALADEDINIQTITTSEIKVSCLIQAKDAIRGARAVHRSLQLHKESPVVDSEIRHIGEQEATAHRSVLTELLDEEVQRLNGMEDIVVLTAEADRSEAKITMNSVPDHPGVASQILKCFADRGISLNVILQNVSHHGVTDFTVTVLRDDLPKALEAAEEARGKLNAAGVTSDRGLAMVSIDGVGMRSHTGVGAKMFAALAEAGANIQMISTSEIRISCGIDERNADDAVTSLRKAFELS